MVTPPNLNFLWARALLDALVSGGVRRLCLSPGSRSAPLAVAAHEHPEIAVSVHIDERSGAFFALGTARARREPVALLCTSGTAAANFHPAVLEAHHSGVPLVVLTADRPPEARHAGAAQTIDQIHLYGGAVRAFHDLPIPEMSLAVLRGAAIQAAYAVARARGPRPGPVHVNVPFREPLAPVPDREAEVAALAAAYEASLHGGRAPRIASLPPGPPAAEAAELASLAGRIGRARHGWIVAGPRAAESPEDAGAILVLARAAGMPVFADIASGLRFAPAAGATVCAHADLFLHAPALAREAPDLVVRLGGLPTSRRIQDALGRHRAEVIHVQPDVERRDPEAWDSTVVVGPVGSVCARLASALARRPGGETVTPWAQAEEIVRSALRETALPIEAEAVRRAAVLLPEGGTLFLSNSLPIRWGEGYVGEAATGTDVQVSRGVNGIDGIVSTALGIAHGSERPMLAAVGDLAFLHDVGGLHAARLVRAPTVLLVLNNGGGGIFAQLPIARFEALSPLFETPHDAALEHAAGLFGLPHARVDSIPALEERVEGALARPGVTIVELASDRRAMARAHAAVVAALVERLAARLG